MATVTAPNRSIVAVLFIVGGALQILGSVLGIANVGNAGGFYLLSNLVLGVGFVLLLVWFASTTITRAGYFLAALGWLLLAVAGLINVPFLSALATLIAIVGTVFAGVVVILTRPFGGHTGTIYADVIFFVAMLAGALNLLLSQNGNVPGILKALVVVLFGALLVVAGILILGKRVVRPTISTGP
jgi:hypothetical protein